MIALRIKRQATACKKILKRYIVDKNIIQEYKSTQLNRKTEEDLKRQCTKNPDIHTADKHKEDVEHLLDHRESKGIPEKHLLLLHWLRL